jgi:hypothetical protein
VLPFERLRYLARYVGDDRTLVEEAADCLADFGDDTPQLVTACRRLLAHHPACGSLWWLCARVVGAANPATAASEAMRVVERDRTAGRLASVLPFPHDEPIAVLGWPETAGAALEERPDLDVVVVRPARSDVGMRSRLSRADRQVRMADETEVMALGCTHLIVEALVASPTTALVPEGTANLRWALSDAETWLVVPIDRLLPDRMFAVVQENVGEDAGELLTVGEVDKIAGPGGLDPPARFATRVDCPVAPELLRL